MLSMSVWIAGLARASFARCFVCIRRTGWPRRETLRMDILSATGPQKLPAEWMPESFAAVVNHLGDNRYRNLFRKNRADIEADRHVHTLQTIARNALDLQLRRDGLDLRSAAN